ncbi:MAG: NLP/P60-family protein, partial [Frankiales bacterium]|nr:NLP/P60-family protein [Frankiales bacterium]
MSHRLVSVRDRWRRRLRGVAVVAAAGGLALPLLVAAGSSSDATGTADAVVALARAQVGDPYVWGATGPDSWDCSGLTSYVWREAGGVVLPRVSRDQQRAAVPIPREQLLPGDLVFYGEPVDHVALYIGSGRVVDASSAKRGVLERALWTAPVTRYGRVARPGMPPVTPWTPPSPSAVPTPAVSASSAP